jgi:sugar O-acyltransferase (sialic acid O-acetyltransferase NeuD family)
VTSAAVSIVRAPRTSASDDRLKLVGVMVADGECVTAGQILFEVEGAKAVSEIAAEASGVLFLAASRGAVVECGAALAVIAPAPMPREAALAALSAPPEDAGGPAASAAGARFTQGAASLLAAYGLGAEVFAGRGLVTSAMVQAYRDQPCGAPDARLGVPARGGSGRVVLVGGGYGANQVLSVLLFEAGTQVVGILDDDARKHGQRIKGVEILGATPMLERLAGEGAVDAAICSIGGNIAARVGVHTAAERAGLRLANAIHPTAAFDDGARLGLGNFFGAFCYVGCDTSIGDNCFFSSRTTIEHHNRVGDHVTTGPNCATSGVVTIGSRVKFGAGVVVEPRLSIGAGSTIASNVAISVDIPANVVVKSRVNLRW